MSARRSGVLRSAQWLISALAMIVVLCCGTAPARATDLVPENLRFYADTLNLTNVYRGLPVALTWKINNNNVMLAELFVIALTIKNNSGTVLKDSIFTDTLDLSPFTKRDYTLRNFWLPQQPGQYSFTLSVNYYNDINRNNDTLRTTVNVRPGAPDIQNVIREAMRKTMTDNSIDSAFSMGYMPTLPLPAGTTISTFDSITPFSTLDKETWVGYLNPNVNTRHKHQSFLHLVNAVDTTDITVRPLAMWPVVNNTPIFLNPEYMTTIFKPSPPLYSGLTSTIHLPATTQLASSRTGAVLITGQGWDMYDQNSLGNAMERVRADLMQDSIGLRLPAKNIYSLVAPTPASIGSAMSGLMGKYDTLAVFYSGHADALGRPLPSSANTLFHTTLLNNLFGTSTKNINIVYDNNNSGQIIDTVRGLLAANAPYRALNITVLTSSAADKTAKDIVFPEENGYSAISEYLLALTRSMGNPEADDNSVPGISLAESYAYIRRTNPTLHTGGSMDTEMRPQLWLHRSIAVGSSTKLEFSDADATLTILPQQTLPPNTMFTVQMSTTPFETQPVDTTVLSISTGRVWKFGVEPAIPFAVDVEIHCRNEYDTLAPLSGIPGLVRREAPGEPWSAHYPTLWDMTNRRLTAKDVTKFSEWAVGIVKEPAPTTEVAEEHSSLFLIGDIRPNPFSSATTIRFECKKAGFVDLAIVDITGTCVQTLASGYYQSGVYYAVFDGSAFSNGVYFCRLHTGDTVQTHTLLHTR